MGSFHASEQCQEIERSLDEASKEQGGLSALKLRFAEKFHAESRIFNDPETASFNAARSALPYGTPINYTLLVSNTWPNDKAVLSHLFTLDASSQNAGHSMSKAEFITFICRCINDIRSGRTSGEDCVAIVELAKLLCAANGWNYEGLPNG